MLATVQFLLNAGAEPLRPWLAGLLLRADAGGRHGDRALCRGRRASSSPAWFLVRRRRGEPALPRLRRCLSRRSRPPCSSRRCRPTHGRRAYCDAYSVGAVRDRRHWPGWGLRQSPRSLHCARPLAAAPSRSSCSALRAARLPRSTFPQCLADPYADLPLVLKSYWLDAVDEAQPLWRMLASDPEAVAGALCDGADRPRRCWPCASARSACAAQEVVLAVMLVAALLSSASGRSAARASPCRWHASRWRSGWRNGAAVPAQRRERPRR